MKILVVLFNSTCGERASSVINVPNDDDLIDGAIQAVIKTWTLGIGDKISTYECFNAAPRACSGAERKTMSNSIQARLVQALEGARTDIVDMIGDRACYGMPITDEGHPWHNVVRKIDAALAAASAPTPTDVAHRLNDEYSLPGSMQWHVDGSTVKDVDGHPVAEVVDEDDGYDAAVIAAAPELLVTLKRIRDARDHCADHGQYPEGVAVDGQAFDDWAADLIDDVLGRRDLNY